MSGARLRFEASGRSWEADLDRARSIARPIRFDGSSARAFGLPAASREAFRAGGASLALEEGGTLDCYGLTIWPHGNGTHTESVGHLARGAPAPCELLGASPLLAALVTLPIARLGDLSDTYEQRSGPDDSVFGADALRSALSIVAAGLSPAALIMRAAPGADAGAPVYLTTEAARVVRAAGVEHLVLELASLDRLEDGGALANHRIFWGLEPGQAEARLARGPRRTITELACVPEELADGLWALQIHLPALITDAVPSRPILSPLTALGSR